MTYPMWPHQQFAYDQFWAYASAGKKRICTVGATGCGKTRIASEITKEALSKGMKVAFSCNRKSLAEQTRKVFEGYGLDPGMRASGYETALDKPLQISMTPTEATRALGKNPSWGLHNADLVFFDEAHNERSARSLALIEGYEKNNPNTIFCGLTATPVDLNGIYDTLIVAGTNSELRECGAHLLCKEFCPTMPDIMKMKRKSDGEFSESVVEKSMKPEIVFGHILPHYRRLNPLMRPTIVFAPSVRGSITITDMFLNAGIPSAHIDAKHIYYGEKDADGRPVMEDSMKIANREKLFDEVRTGEIKIISSRFLLTEGIDLPQVGHLIFATSYGSLKMYLQAGGRLLRAHDSLDTVTCIARDSDVLTDRGLVKIQDVKLSDKVWDGVEFVSHGGAVCKGNQQVIEWDGVTATPEHKVYTSHGWETIEKAKNSNRRIAQTGIRGRAIRLSSDNQPEDRNKKVGSDLCRGSLRQVRRGFFPSVSVYARKEMQRLRSLHAEIRPALSGVVVAKSSNATSKVCRRRKASKTVRRKGYRVSVPFNLRRGLLDSRESWNPRKQESHIRSNRQRRTLRTWQFAMGRSLPANEQYRNCHQVKGEIQELQRLFEEAGSKEGLFKLSDQEILRSGNASRASVGKPERLACRDVERAGVQLSSNWIHQEAHQKTDEERDEPQPNSRVLGRVSEVAEVWDIINCGPRECFTVSDRLVHNCQDHGANCLVHGSLNDDRIWDLGDSSKSLLEKTLKERKEGKSQEPIICPKCGAMRLSGPACHECGHKGSNSGINILEHDGTLRQMKGPYVTRKANTTSDAIKAWNNIYFPSSKSRNPKSMTFKQALAQYKNRNKHLTVFNTVDGKGKERVAVAESNGTLSFLPMMPPVGNDYLWSQKVRDVQKKDLL